MMLVCWVVCWLVAELYCRTEIYLAYGLSNRYSEYSVLSRLEEGEGHIMSSKKARAIIAPANGESLARP